MVNWPDIRDAFTLSTIAFLASPVKMVHVGLSHGRPGFLIPLTHEPEGNMIELFPSIENVPLPEKAVCPPEHIDEALAQVRAALRS